MAVDGIEIRGKDHRVPDRSDAIPLSPDGFTTAGEIADLATPGGGAPIVTVIAADTDITVAPFNGTTIVLYVALTAPRTVTLPAADGPSQVVIVKDDLALVTDSITLTVVPADGDTVSASSQFSFAPTNDGMVAQFTNNGVTDWPDISEESGVSADLQDQINTLLAQLGGTDGDGNVYSIQYDAAGEFVGVQCATAGAGPVHRVGVGPSGPVGDGLSVVRAFAFAFDTPDLLTGAALYTPTPGDILLDAWIEIDTAWDGTDAKLDIGSFSPDGLGWYAYASNPILLDAPDIQLSGALCGSSPLATSLYQQVVAGSARIAPNRLIGDPIKVCVSQDGTNTGDDPGSTQGAAVLYLVTATPVGG